MRARLDKIGTRGWPAASAREIVDCSTIVDALSGVPGTDSLRARLVDEGAQAFPTLLDYELVSVVARSHLGGAYRTSGAEHLLADFEA